MAAKEVQITIEDIRYNLEGSIDDVILALQRLKTKYTREGMTKLSIDISTESDYGGGEYACAHLRGFRMETPEETLLREAGEAKRQQFLEQREREQFEALKKKYG